MLQGYFRTGPGEYGEGDVFLGVRMPDVRAVAKAHRDLPLPALASLLRSKHHEDRLLAVVVLADRAARAEPAERDRLARFYLRHLDRVNNWDLVDSSAPQVLGPYFLKRSRAPPPQRPAAGEAVQRRVAILTTQHFLRKGEVAETLRLAKVLLHDKHDLIHKAVGWMLREAGQREPAALRQFLQAHAHEMPRTMLRYSLERLPAAERARWMGRNDRRPVPRT